MKLSGILIAIDFEKVFDSLDHKYIFKVLQLLNFGPSFIQWIRIFYSNKLRYVIKNDFTSDYFIMNRGVRQGVSASFYSKFGNSGKQYSTK